MKKGFCIFSILFLLLTPFSISAEEIPSSNTLHYNGETGIMTLDYIFPESTDDFSLLSSQQKDYIKNNQTLIGEWNYIAYCDRTSSSQYKSLVFSNVDTGLFSASLSESGIYTNVSIDWTSGLQDLYYFKIDTTFNAFDCGSNSFDFDTFACSLTTSKPNVNLPTPNVPNITTNTEQSTYINSISSPASLGAVINYFRYDYFNIYAVHSSALDFSILDEQDILVKYQIDSTGRYLIPVYDHSEVVIYGPNLTISTSGLQITPSLYSGVSYSFPNSNGIIQRDINRFDYTYVDLEMLNMYPYEDLPFSNSSTNTGKVDYLGQQLSVRSGGTGSRSIMLEFNGQNYSTTFYIVSTDSFKDIEQAKQEQNQTIINNNITSNFNELDSTLQHGNSLTQGSKNNLDIANNGLNSTINQYNQLDQQANQDLINDLNAIDLNDFAINGLIQLSNSSNFVRTQFNNLTANNPIGTSVGFALVVGLSLLLLAKRL